MADNSLFSLSIYHGYMLQILIAEIVFTLNLKRRNNFILRAVLGILVFLILSIVVPNYIARYISGLFSLVIFLLSLCLCKFCFENRFRDILFCCVGAQLTQNLSFNVERLIWQPFADSGSTVLWLTVSILTTAAVYTACYFLFAKRLEDEPGTGMDSRGIYLFSVTAALFTYVMQYLFQIYEIDHLWIIRPPLVLCCICGLCVQFEWVALAGRKEENQLLERMMKQEHRQYEITKNSIDMINMKAHDLKHQITRIRNIGSGDDLELNSIESIIEQYEMNIITGNTTLDVIAAEKQLLCQKNHIKLNVMAEGSALSFLKPADIAALFGNALDNAVECECQIGDRDKRCIFLDVHKKGNLLTIRVENYCPFQKDFVDGFPVTSKSDASNHGFGIRSIRYIAEKYDGTVQAGIRGSLFILSVMLPIPEEGQNLPK